MQVSTYVMTRMDMCFVCASRCGNGKHPKKSRRAQVSSRAPPPLSWLHKHAQYLCMSHSCSVHVHIFMYLLVLLYICSMQKHASMGWLRLVGSLQLYVSFAKEPYKRDYIPQKRPTILWSLLIVATPYRCCDVCTVIHVLNNTFPCVITCNTIQGCS